MTWKEFNKECKLPLCNRNCKYFNECRLLEFSKFIEKQELYCRLLKLYRKEKLEKLLS